MMSVCFVDPSAIKTLIAMYKDFKSRGLLFCIADCSGKGINHKCLQVFGVTCSVHGVLCGDSK